jgi:hypothetical protein
VDQESIVYGCIKGSSSLSTSELFSQTTTNKKAILALPLVDDWPVLTQEMFSIPRFQMDGNLSQTNVIHFGASYRGIEYEWAEWIKKFEALLKAMYWQSAVVHLETELTGLHTFTWETVDKNHIPGSDDFNIRCEWNHELGLVESTA